ncbi:putative beta-lysine N-acetyltransferase [Anaerobaca lacustris]|uniref:Beta-lysine N-acetyltransferase n=1 Tax=Anaerobaca lacustris TaxID=3044600 RepID=A0AAW6U2B7_9BACT|nr:putative beta-lysine N-acetyltransferase [Sedimentisphaerales bacterium M17dextr]
MPDVIEKIGRSLIQHGPDSDRIYLMKLAPADAPAIVERIERLAETRDYGKLFCKVPAPWREPFVQAGYREEARIPNFLAGRIDVAFMSRFRKPERATMSVEQKAAVDNVLQLALARRCDAESQPTTQTRRLLEDDTPDLADLYRSVFPSYPFPIFDADYLRHTMATHIRYYGAFDGDRLVAAASAETDAEGRNAEMTDFATAPEHRKKGLAVALLLAMESDMKDTGFLTLYTIARAVSAGMNITFARCGYAFSGTLVNNTQIAGGIESMNVWYKNLTTPP